VQLQKRDACYQGTIRQHDLGSISRSDGNRWLEMGTKARLEEGSEDSSGSMLVRMSENL